MPKQKPQFDEVGEELADLQSEIIADETADTPIVEQTRDYIARLVLKAFFFLFGAILIGGPIYNANVQSELRLNLPDLLQQYAAILGPILGFVIGYYFKAKE